MQSATLTTSIFYIQSLVEKNALVARLPVETKAASIPMCKHLYFYPKVGYFNSLWGLTHFQSQPQADIQGTVGL